MTVAGVADEALDSDLSAAGDEPSAPDEFTGLLLVTTVTPPPGAQPGTLAGRLEIEEDGCTYLDDGGTRHWLIWPWHVQLDDARPGVLEDFEAQRVLAGGGDRVGLEVARLDGQRVEGGPCATDGPPAYVTGY